MTSSRNSESGRSWIQQNALGAIIVGLLTLALVVVGLGILLEGRLDTLESNIVTRPAQGVEMAPVDSATHTLTVGATLYVPVYSHIYENGGKELLLETTLSIRNTDPSREIVVEAVDYYDGTGTLVRSYLDSPASLAPLASTEYLVDRKDRAGGAGANFLVSWASAGEVSEPLVEAVMVGTTGNRALAFARPARVVSVWHPDTSGRAN